MRKFGIVSVFSILALFMVLTATVGHAQSGGTPTSTFAWAGADPNNSLNVAVSYDVDYQGNPGGLVKSNNGDVLTVVVTITYNGHYYTTCSSEIPYGFGSCSYEPAQPGNYVALVQFLGGGGYAPSSYSFQISYYPF